MTVKNGKIWVQNVIFAGKRKGLNEFIANLKNLTIA